MNEGVATDVNIPYIPTPANNDHKYRGYFDAGIGIRQAVGSRSNLYVMVAWHLYDSYNNAWFGDPIPTVSVGFEI